MPVIIHGQILVRSKHDVNLLIAGRNGRMLLDVDTITINKYVDKVLSISNKGWSITLINTSNKSSFDFVVIEPNQIIEIDSNLAKSKVLHSPLNDSVRRFSASLYAAHAKRECAAQQQLAAFQQKDMKGYASWSDSLAAVEKQMGIVAAAQIADNPYSRVSQFAFGLYCYHMPEDSFFASYQRLALAGNLSLLFPKQLAQFEHQVASRVGMPLPTFAITTIDGNTINPGIADGKVRVLYFTASFCGPCRLLKPELEKLSHNPKYKNVEIVSISLEDNENGRAIAIADAMKTIAPMQMVVTNSKINLSNQLFIGGYPTLIIADDKAVITKRILGFTDSTLPSLEAELERLLK